MNILYIVLAVVVVYLIYAYNKLVTMRLRAKEAISDIEVQMKRRFDLIPNLVESVKGYMKHERGVLENVTKARAAVAGAGDAEKKREAENMLSNTLKTLFAVAENYPDLKANANFLELQRELSDTENKVQAARRFYNTTVRDLNTSIEVFPTNIVANAFGFRQMEFYDAPEEAEQPVKVNF
ncbi:MAG: LemA family protein [Candidatus Liptonbacteria bacterium]|nr:LemA family protein [Candidatus Liptonbacteria bacterium]